VSEQVAAVAHPVLTALVRVVVVPWQALIEEPSMRRFADIEQIPDWATIPTFCHLLRLQPPTG